MSVSSAGVTRHFQRNNIKFDLPNLLTPNTASFSEFAQFRNRNICECIQCVPFVVCISKTARLFSLEYLILVNSGIWWRKNSEMSWLFLQCSGSEWFFGWFSDKKHLAYCWRVLVPIEERGLILWLKVCGVFFP